MSIFIITDPVDEKDYEIVIFITLYLIVIFNRYIKPLPDELKRTEEGNYSIKNSLYFSQLTS